MGTHTHRSSYANIINVITKAWVLISGGQRGHANLPTYLEWEGEGGWKSISNVPHFLDGPYNNFTKYV